MSEGKCGNFAAKAACITKVLGAVSMLAAVVTRLCPMAPMHLGPRSFAALAGLLFLNSIAISSCPCCGRAASCETPKP